MTSPFFAEIFTRQLTTEPALEQLCDRSQEGTRKQEWPIGHVQYINILTWLRGFQGKFLYLVLFSLHPSIFWKLSHKSNLTKFPILTREFWSHVRIFIYGTWPIPFMRRAFKDIIFNWLFVSMNTTAMTQCKRVSEGIGHYLHLTV